MLHTIRGHKPNKMIHIMTHVLCATKIMQIMTYGVHTILGHGTKYDA